MSRYCFTRTRFSRDILSMTFMTWVCVSFGDLQIGVHAQQRNCIPWPETWKHIDWWEWVPKADWHGICQAHPQPPHLLHVWHTRLYGTWNHQEARPWKGCWFLGTWLHDLWNDHKYKSFQSRRRSATGKYCIHKILGIWERMKGPTFLNPSSIPCMGYRNEHENWSWVDLRSHLSIDFIISLMHFMHT